MRTWKRGFIEIVGEILESLSKKPLKKSHISYQCNLDARAVTKYLNFMLQLKIVEKSKYLNCYQITTKGIKFLEQYITLTKFLQKDLKIEHKIKKSYIYKPQINI
ncbi:MAG: winged helix-turn-helix domain-containing protein [Nitrosopumilaceae archaeon]